MRNVMGYHEFLDKDVVAVNYDANPDVVIIRFKASFEGSFLFSKDDAIALAKQFGLAVFDLKTQL